MARNSRREKAYTESESTGGNMNVTRRRILNLTHWGAAPDRRAESAGWLPSYLLTRRGVVVSGVRRINEVNARRARLVPGWVTVFGQVCHLAK